MTIPTFVLGAVRTFVIALLAFPLHVISAEDLPRYKFEAGQELSYRIVYPRNEWDDDKGGRIIEYSSTLQWNIYVVRKNDDETWRFVFTNQWTGTSPQSPFDLYSDGYFDLAPDGRLVANETLPTGPSDITALFPPLPLSTESFATTWQSTSPVDGTQRTLRVLQKDVPSSTKECEIGEEARSVLNSVLERTEYREYAFDCEQGLVRRGTIALKQKFHRRPFDTTLPIEFASKRQLGSAELKQLDAESDRFVAASEQYLKLLNRALHRDVQDAENLLDKAESGLRQLATHSQLPLIATMVDHKLKVHGQNRAYYLSSAKDAARWLDKPAPEWRTTDLDGNPHALADYRGKVVVLDFWHRGCNWCIHGMPQVKQLVEDFKGRNVTILGINSDEDASDARFVIEKAQLNYLTLKNEQMRISRAHNVTAYPSVIVIDTKGVIRRVHVGYSPNLRRDTRALIDELLTTSGP